MAETSVRRSDPQPQLGPWLHLTEADKTAHSHCPWALVTCPIVLVTCKEFVCWRLAWCCKIKREVPRE